MDFTTAVFHLAAFIASDGKRSAAAATEAITRRVLKWKQVECRYVDCFHIAVKFFLWFFLSFSRVYADLKGPGMKKSTSLLLFLSIVTHYFLLLCCSTLLVLNLFAVR